MFSFNWQGKARLWMIQWESVKMITHATMVKSSCSDYNNFSMNFLVSRKNFPLHYVKKWNYNKYLTCSYLFKSFSNIIFSCLFAEYLVLLISLLSVRWPPIKIESLITDGMAHIQWQNQTLKRLICATFNDINNSANIFFIFFLFRKLIAVMFIDYQYSERLE